ncbi:hypothetical protein [Bordetella petrii]|uniref:hypothetical protein n=1 Tax=Bordetella petrii TaxID=94624 RepID=UPI001A960E5E|nr:hypothetical protein [Bordetella petrii]MBO1110678.1 hypothetical protein [Bordetella petrii]
MLSSTPHEYATTARKIMMTAEEILTLHSDLSANGFVPLMWTMISIAAGAMS